MDEATTVGFDLRLFTIVDENGCIGNIRRKDEPAANTVFFKDFQHLERVVKQLMTKLPR